VPEEGWFELQRSVLLSRRFPGLLLCLLLIGGACDAPIVEAPGTPDAVDDGSTGTTPQDGTAVDSGVPEDLSGVADAAEDSPVVEDTAEAPPEADFVLGFNETGKNQPGAFTELPEGGDLFVELGAQGLWMVVLAFKTYGHFDGKVIIRATLSVGGESQGELALAKQKLVPGGDGWDYYYNFFLIVPDPALAGQQAMVTMKVQDDETQEYRVDLSRSVVLTGGQP
jgi:hypothetical protein